jgi:predicted alpha/beta-hydrolase family hydrolase
MRAVQGAPSRPLRRALHGARPPGLMLVGEPDELGLESAHPQLTLRARLIELAEADGHITADDKRTPARLDDDHLQTARVARRRYEAEPGQQLELAVDRLVAHARRVDPLADV